MIDKIIAKLPTWARAPAEVLYGAAQEFGKDRASRMAAAIAYRAVFALAPLLMIVIAVVGAFLGSRAEAQLEILDTVESIAGPDVALALGNLITSATASANTAAIVGGVLLVWTASSLFLEVQRDLNDIFETPQEQVSGIWATVRTRGIAFIWALGLGLILIATWGLSAVWRFLGDLLPESMSAIHDLVVVLGPVVSLLILPVVFGIVFQSMTAISVPWRAVWIGGLFTSAVFIAAAYGIGVYFQYSEPTALGFTGSLVIVIFLAYFFSVVFLFGAEVTKVYADRLEARAAGPAVVSPFADDPQVVVAEPPSGLPRSAFAAFLIGLVVGWRRTKR